MFDKNAEPHDPTRSGAPPMAWYERRGSGPPLALLPGAPGMASDYLEPVADLLSDGFEVILVDPPGCGGRRRSKWGLHAVLEAIDEVHAALGLDRWLIGGHSFGADLTLAHALELPRRTLGVLAISPTGVQDDPEWHGEITIIGGAGHCPWWTHPTELREAAPRLTVVEPDTPLPGR